MPEHVLLPISPLARFGNRSGSNCGLRLGQMDKEEEGRCMVVHSISLAGKCRKSLYASQ